jgi:hypothetical protein
MGMLGLGRTHNFVPIAAGTLISMKDYSGVDIFVTGGDTYTLKTAATYNGSPTALATISTYWTNTSTSGAAAWVAASQAAASTLVVSSGAAYFYVDAADMPSLAEYIEVTAAGSGLVYMDLINVLPQRTPENLRVASGSTS